MSKLLSVSTVVLVLTACTGVLGLASEHNLQEYLMAEARDRVSHLGGEVWHVLVQDQNNVDGLGEHANVVWVWNAPRKVHGNLCKAKAYIYEVADYPAAPKWSLVDSAGRGHSTMFAAVLVNSQDLGCSELSVERYFNVHEPIEDGTLVALYSRFLAMVAHGKIEEVGEDLPAIHSIRVLEKRGWDDGVVYRVYGETKISKRYFAVDLRLESASFVVSE